MKFCCTLQTHLRARLKTALDRTKGCCCYGKTTRLLLLLLLLHLSDVYSTISTYRHIPSAWYRVCTHTDVRLHAIT